MIFIFSMGNPSTTTGESMKGIFFVFAPWFLKQIHDNQHVLVWVCRKDRYTKMSIKYQFIRSMMIHQWMVLRQTGSSLERAFLHVVK